MDTLGRKQVNTQVNKQAYSWMPGMATDPTLYDARCRICDGDYCRGVLELLKLTNKGNNAALSLMVTLMTNSGWDLQRAVHSCCTDAVADPALSPAALYCLGYMFEHGNSVVNKIDLDKAIDNYDQAANLGFFPAAQAHVRLSQNRIRLEQEKLQLSQERLFSLERLQNRL